MVTPWSSGCAGPEEWRACRNRLGSAGVQAAALTTIVSIIMFVATQVSVRASATAVELPLALAVLWTITSVLSQFAVSIVIYVGPLLADSVYGNRRLNQ
jgi:hypothetical protein